MLRPKKLIVLWVLSEKMAERGLKSFIFGLLSTPFVVFVVEANMLLDSIGLCLVQLSHCEQKQNWSCSKILVLLIIWCCSFLVHPMLLFPWASGFPLLQVREWLKLVNVTDALLSSGEMSFDMFAELLCLFILVECPIHAMLIVKLPSGFIQETSFIFIESTIST